MPKAIKPVWWKNIAPLQGGRMEQDVLFGLLMLHRSTPWCLTGVSGVTDSFLLQLPPALTHLQEVIGAVELDDATLVALSTSEEGYASTCEWLIVPGRHLQTPLPNLPVQVVRNPGKGWDDPSKNQKEVPEFIDLVSHHTSQVLVSMGNEYADAYYPTWPSLRGLF